MMTWLQHTTIIKPTVVWLLTTFHTCINRATYVYGCLTNLYADNSMIYASGDNILEVQQKLQQCVNNISSWYKINRLKINIDKTKVMLIGSKTQLKSLNVHDFFLSYDDTPLELVENAKYLGMFINFVISWDFHVRRLWQSTYYPISDVAWDTAFY